MNPIEQIINSAPLYLNDWTEDGLKGLENDFRTTIPSDCRILLASYTYEDYSGSAFVLFAKDGKLFEVNGGHCSCYGLEDQWEPEETTVEALVHRLQKGTLGASYGVNEYSAELKNLLGII